jgi:hypothetical protein
LTGWRSHPRDHAPVDRPAGTASYRPRDAVLTARPGAPSSGRTSTCVDSMRPSAGSACETASLLTNRSVRTASNVKGAHLNRRPTFTMTRNRRQISSSSTARGCARSVIPAIRVGRNVANDHPGRLRQNARKNRRVVFDRPCQRTGPVQRLQRTRSQIDQETRPVLTPALALATRCQARTGRETVDRTCPGASTERGKTRRAVGPVTRQHAPAVSQARASCQLPASPADRQGSRSPARSTLRRRLQVGRQRVAICPQRTSYLVAVGPCAVENASETP